MLALPLLVLIHWGNSQFGKKSFIIPVREGIKVLYVSYKAFAGMDPLRFLSLPSRSIISLLSSSVEVGWKRNSPLSVFFFLIVLTLTWSSNKIFLSVCLILLPILSTFYSEESFKFRLFDISTK